MTLLSCGGSSPGCAYPGNPGDTSTGRPATPATPGSPGFPRGVGFKGAWVNIDEPLVALGGGHDFVWESSWLNGAGTSSTTQAIGRPIIFRLTGNAKVKIYSVTGRGVVAAGGRSAYSCADTSGQITVNIYAEFLADLEDPNLGQLWGIDAMGGGTAAGEVAEFEVVAP